MAKYPIREIIETTGVGRYGVSGQKTHAIHINWKSDGTVSHATPLCMSQRANTSKTRIISHDAPTQETVTCDKCRQFGCVTGSRSVSAGHTEEAREAPAAAKTVRATEAQKRELSEAREMWEVAQSENWEHDMMAAAAVRLTDAEYDIFGDDTPTF